jgi:excinuclease ABC subunit C
LGSEARVIELARNSQEFYLLQRIQDEVHRFAITFHRQVRSDSMFKSELDGIVGVGPKRKALLLKHFRSVAGIRDAKPEEMVKLGINEQLAFNILEHLNKED